MECQPQGQKWNKSWTQLDLDLICCIRYDYPCIYMDDGGGNRSTRVKRAWEDIGNSIKDVPVAQLKSRWKDIRDYYVRNKGKTSGWEYKKYFDGTLSFLDHTLIHDDNVYDNIFQQNEGEKDLSQVVTMVSKDSTEVRRPSVDPIASGSNIRQLIHEEIDILDNDIDIKVEPDADTQHDKLLKALEEMTRPDNDNKAGDEDETAVDEEDHEPQHKWDEEELLNATRLTQEMVEELIYIKTKSYYLAPTTSPSK